MDIFLQRTIFFFIFISYKFEKKNPLNWKLAKSIQRSQTKFNSDIDSFINIISNEENVDIIEIPMIYKRYSRYSINWRKWFSEGLAEISVFFARLMYDDLIFSIEYLTLLWQSNDWNLKISSLKCDIFFKMMNIDLSTKKY